MRGRWWFVMLNSRLGGVSWASRVVLLGIGYIYAWSRARLIWLFISIVFF